MTEVTPCVEPGTGKKLLKLTKRKSVRARRRHCLGESLSPPREQVPQIPPLLFTHLAPGRIHCHFYTEVTVAIIILIPVHRPFLPVVLCQHQLHSTHLPRKRGTKGSFRAGHPTPTCYVTLSRAFLILGLSFPICTKQVWKSIPYRGKKCQSHWATNL